LIVKIGEVLKNWPGFNFYRQPVRKQPALAAISQELDMFFINELLRGEGCH